jgi:hypothetical protein
MIIKAPGTPDKQAFHISIVENKKQQISTISI